ncbi:glycosyltransferase [Planctomycetaceae bacterium SH139]
MITQAVTLVIPGRNCASTLDRCLSSVVPLKESGELEEIIFVDDGSTDATSDIAARYPVRVIQGTGQGPGAARNLGWQTADTELIWFIDSDCVAEPDALARLLAHVGVPASAGMVACDPPKGGTPTVAGVGGSYTNLYPDSLVATLIHEEIVARHRRMKREVDFLATFNVIYRRSVLEELGGFNEALKLAQDAEFSYRVRAAGHRLNFELESRVGHHHPRNLWRYLKTQCRQGYYRIMLYRQHPTKAGGDSYSGILDFLPPPVGLLCLILAPTLLLADARLSFLVVALALLLIALHFPITMRLARQGGASMWNFLWFGSVRAIARGLGLAYGAAVALSNILLTSPREFTSSSQPSGLSVLSASEPKE